VRLGFENAERRLLRAREQAEKGDVAEAARLVKEYEQELNRCVERMRIAE
jgi:hypothetical protein